MGFTLHIYIIFGTNLLTGGPTQITIFCLFQSFTEKEYQTESKRNETFGSDLSGTNMIQRTWSGRQERSEEATRQGGPPAPLGAPPTLVGSPGLFCSISDAPWASSGPKTISVKFQVNWTPFGIPFLRYSKTRNKHKLALVSRLIGQSQKSYKIAYKCI